MRACAPSLPPAAVPPSAGSSTVPLGAMIVVRFCMCTGRCGRPPSAPGPAPARRRPADCRCRGSRRGTGRARAVRGRAAAAGRRPLCVANARCRRRIIEARSRRRGSNRPGGARSCPEAPVAGRRAARLPSRARGGRFGRQAAGMSATAFELLGGEPVVRQQIGRAHV